MKRSGFKRKSYQWKRTLKPLGFSGRKRLRAKSDRRLAKWSKEVKERDGNRCQWPGGCQTGDARIDAHHIAERSLRPDLKYSVRNGLALCRTHHDWLPSHRQLAIAMGLLSDETYEKAKVVTD